MCGSAPIPHTFWVVDALSHNVILGLSWLYQLKAELSFQSETFQFTHNGRSYSCPLSPPSFPPRDAQVASIFSEFSKLEIDAVFTSQRHVRALQKQSIAPRSFATFRVSVSPIPLTGPAIMTLNPSLREVLGAQLVKFLFEPSCDHVTLFNTSSEVVIIPKGAKIGRLSAETERLALAAVTLLSYPPPLV
jgi:hypothetical protein